MGYLDEKRLKALVGKPARYADGGGLFFEDHRQGPGLIHLPLHAGPPRA